MKILDFISPPQCKYMNFHISKIFIHLDVYLDPIQLQRLPTTLLSGCLIFRKNRNRFKSVSPMFGLAMHITITPCCNRYISNSALTQLTPFNLIGQ